jgi:hypothetical protein
MPWSSDPGAAAAAPAVQRLARRAAMGALCSTVEPALLGAAPDDGDSCLRASVHHAASAGGRGSSLYVWGSWNFKLCACVLACMCWGTEALRRACGRQLPGWQRAGVASRRGPVLNVSVVAQPAVELAAAATVFGRVRGVWAWALQALLTSGAWPAGITDACFGCMRFPVHACFPCGVCVHVHMHPCLPNRVRVYHRCACAHGCHHPLCPSLVSAAQSRYRGSRLQQR